jgi:UDP-N-acetylglucosamine--N-acetylmuramyl-(pentapeptide) pyrophosphoryl-undecaprenol N-acetylglucosamine transferase
MDDHQTANATAFAASGGGWVISQSEFISAALAERLAALFSDPGTLDTAAAASRGFAHDDAAEHLAGLVQSLVPGSNGGPMEHAA